MCTDDDATTTPTIVMIMAVAVAAAVVVVVVLTAVVIHGGLFEIGQPWEKKKVLVRIHQNVILMILSSLSCRGLSGCITVDVEIRFCFLQANEHVMLA